MLLVNHTDVYLRSRTCVSNPTSPNMAVRALVQHLELTSYASIYYSVHSFFNLFVTS